MGGSAGEVVRKRMRANDNSVNPGEVDPFPSTPHEWHGRSLAVSEWRACQPRLLDVRESNRVVIPQAHGTAVRHGKTNLLEDVLRAADLGDPFMGYQREPFRHRCASPPAAYRARS
jgi:hypothetical protein